VPILFEDSRLLKAQLFLVPHDKVSDPKSVNIDILNGEELIMSEAMTRALSCWRVRQNRTNSASKSSETNRGWPGCRALKRKVEEGIHKSCLETITAFDHRLISLRRLSRISTVR
jgi:hypothetical protein